MPLVSVMINQRPYTVACDDGEEEHLHQLAAHVDSKVRELLESVGQAGEQRLLLMAALLIADDHLDSVALLETRAREMAEVASARDELAAQLTDREQRATTALRTAAQRVEDIAARVGGG